MIHIPLSTRVRFYLVLTIILGLAGSLLAVIQALLISRVIARVFLDHQGLASVSPLFTLLVIVVLWRGIIALGSELCSTSAGSAARESLRQTLHQALITFRPGYETHERSGELTAVVTEGVEAVEAYFSQYLPQLALAALIPLAILVFIFPRDWLSGLILLVTAPLLPLFLYLIGTLSNSLTRQQFTRLSRLSAHFLDTLQGLKTLKELGRSRDYGQVIARVSEQYRDATLAVLRVSFLSALALEVVGMLSIAILAVEASLRLIDGGMSFETALFILIVAPEFYLPIRTLGLRFHTGSAGMNAAKQIAEVLGEESLPSPLGRGEGEGECNKLPPPSPLPLSQGEREKKSFPSPLPPSIAFSSVTYTYPGSGTPALEGLSFCIAHGETVVLAGESGAGKSTIARLLLGILHPDSGSITINGITLDDLSPQDWRSQVAWVPQEPYLFNGTLLSNLTLSNPNASTEQVNRAARAAGLATWVESLPQGYHTPVGEHGLRVSSGEAQRIALGRAFLKNAPFLLLDEPTTYLDPELEDDLQAVITHLGCGKTALIIAHRASTLHNAARLLVLDSGHLVQDGSPQSLAAQPGPLRRLLDASGGA